MDTSKIISVYAVPGLMDLDKVVGLVFGVLIEDLKSRNRERRVADARFVAMWYRHKHMGESQQKAGAPYDRDHSTVVHACKQVELLCDVDVVFRGKVEEVVRLVGREIFN